jgi:CBS domain containing-hemolysin-like protein
MNELKKGIPTMKRRHVLQTLAVMSASSTTLVAFGESSPADVALAVPENLSAALKNSRQLCVDLLSRLARIESRNGMLTGSNSAVSKAATDALQESSVLLEQTDDRISSAEHRPVALFQACADSLMRVEMPLKSLSQSGILPGPVVDSSVAVFGQVRQLLLSLHF